MLMLSACGHTSNLHKSSNHPDSSDRPDLTAYNHIIIYDFKDGVSKSKDSPNIISEGKRFSDLLASAIQAKNIFDKVERNVNSVENILVIEGEITQYEEGSPAMRTLIGLGAGSSHFDAKITFIDNKTKQILGNVDVNKMSWALGGMIAGSQDVRSLMNDAVSKIVSELVLAKKAKEAKS